MRLKRLCLAAVAAALLSGCAAGRSASVNLVEQVDVPPAHAEQYSPRAADGGRRGSDEEADDSQNSTVFPRGKSVSQSRVTEVDAAPYEASAEELDDYIIETGLLTRLRERNSDCVDDGCDEDADDSPLCSRLRERFRERRESGPFATPLCDRLRANFRRDACGDSSRHPLRDRLRERLHGDGDHPLCDRIRDRLHGEGERPLGDCIRKRLNGEGERPLCDALSSLFCCEVPDGPWPFCGTETWDPAGKNCRCSSHSRTVIPQPSAPQPYDVPRPLNSQPDGQELQTPADSTPPQVPGTVPMPSDVPDVPESVPTENLPGEPGRGKVVEPPLWFRIKEQEAAPVIEPMPEPASEAGTDPAPVPEPDAVPEPMPVPPAVEENTGEGQTGSELPAAERPELPPLPSGEPQPEAELPASSPPPVPAPRLRQTRVPRTTQRRE